VELPDAAKAAAGLDNSRQWVLVSECNIDTWPFDVRALPDRPGTFHYGHLPPRMFKTVRDRFVERYRSGRMRLVNRDGT